MVSLTGGAVTTLTMWRGNELLGELRQGSWEREAAIADPGKPISLKALLVRAPDAPPCEAVYQVAIGGFVVQYPIEPGGETQNESVDPTAREGGRHFGLKPIPPEDLLPPKKQLTVRDEAGRVYRPAFLHLETWVEMMFASAADAP